MNGLLNIDKFTRMFEGDEFLYYLQPDLTNRDPTLKQDLTVDSAAYSQKVEVTWLDQYFI